MQTIAKGWNNKAVGAVQTFELMVDDAAGALTGKFLLVNGTASTARTEAAIRSNGEPTGEARIFFTRTDANANAVRELRRTIAPGSQVECEAS